MEKLIVTVGITGSRITRQQTPHIPITPGEIAQSGVGLEDNIYYSRGVLAQSNAQLVERVVRISREFERDIALPSEARQILHLS